MLAIWCHDVTADSRPQAPVVWTSGATAHVSWGQFVDHGGGYQYRLCKKAAGRAITEACFQQTPLAFASSKQTVIYEDGSHPNATLTAVDVTEGTTPAGSTFVFFPCFGPLASVRWGEIASAFARPSRSHRDGTACSGTPIICLAWYWAMALSSPCRTDRWPPLGPRL